MPRTPPSRDPLEEPTLPPRPATIDDVAELAGVARTTVSRVLNNLPNVRPAVQEKVRAAMKALGYEADPGARALASGGRKTIALISSIDLEGQPDSYYHAALEVGAMRNCVRAGFHLTTHRIPEQSTTRVEAVMAIAGRGRMGLILAPPFSEDPHLLDLLVANGNPVCAISPGMATGKVASVGIDDHQAGADAARHLRALGHEDFGFIAGRETHLSTDRRLSGFRAGLVEAGLAPDRLLVIRDEISFGSGARGLARLTDARPAMTAIMCANDDVAAGAVFAAHERGIRVPHDLSIMGFDDTPLSSAVWPPLTTVRQPIQEMAERAADLVINGDTGSAIVIPHRIIHRASTGTPSPREA
jgi:LacI family transcriptional regulator